MARIARVVVPGCAYHVTHRGNRREDIFLRAEDRGVYRDRLIEYAERFALEIWAYCWMTNHVHLVVVAHRADSLARAIGNGHRSYARWINLRQGWSGHLWSNRFYSTALDGASLFRAVRYVELNPVRAALVTEAADYRWSSAAAHVRGEEDPVLSSGRPFPGPVGDWAEFLRCGLDPEHLDSLRANTRTGRPTGSPKFVRHVEETVGRHLGPFPRGRRPGNGKSGTATDLEHWRNSVAVPEFRRRG